MGCDRVKSLLSSVIIISIHAPTWGATRRKYHCKPDKKFQSTHPRGVRLIRLGSTPTAFAFQSTHPRGVRRYGRIDNDIPAGISIHAPTWGATIQATVQVVNKLFQSTHPRGVRHKVVRGGRQGYLFQSTHPRGVRHAANVAKTFNSSFQSTHPRGVRLNTGPYSPIRNYFNPRTHVGCDPTTKTRPHCTPYFNPRTHVGCDC